MLRPLIVAGTLLVIACGDDDAAVARRAVARENALPGSEGWLPSDPARAGEIEAYAPRPSFAAGEEVPIHVSTKPPLGYRWRVFRAGWYGGARARLYAEGGPLAGRAQATPTPDPVTGLVEAGWSPSFTISTRHADGDAWLTGVYLVQLTREDGKQSYAIFVLRDDRRAAEIGLQLPTATWQAYNRWGGESLYASAQGLSGGKARVVSFERPYFHELGFGSGSFLSIEHPAVSWFESQGYDVEYLTSHDVGDPAARIGRHRLLVMLGHDEYGTLEELDRLQAAVGAGTSLAFLSGNTLYWQVRYENGGRTLVCYKDKVQEDPLYGVDGAHVTTRFRDPPVSRPENALIGVLSWGDTAEAQDWVVEGADHWVYDGTGLASGDRIPEVVGFEWDGLADNGATPAGIVVLAQSSVAGSSDPHHATIYERPGAFVFAAGTIYFGRRLADEPSIARMMQNLAAGAGADRYTP